MSAQAHTRDRVTPLLLELARACRAASFYAPGHGALRDAVARAATAGAAMVAPAAGGMATRAAGSQSEQSPHDRMLVGAEPRVVSEPEPEPQQQKEFWNDEEEEFSDFSF